MKEDIHKDLREAIDSVFKKHEIKFPENMDYCSYLIKFDQTRDNQLYNLTFDRNLQKLAL